MKNRNIEEIQGHCLSTENNFRKSLISRINRIAGQLRGIERMILNHVKCDEILNQISSVKSALNGIAKVILEAHLRSCVVNEIKSGLEEEATEELIKTLESLLNKNIKKINESNDNIIKKVEIQVEKIKECIEKDECCSSILKEIAIIKNELDSVSRVILERHIKNCLVRDIELGLEEKIVNDFLYTINKMIK